MSQETHATLAGNPVHMIRPHLRNVPEVGLPKGYAIRPLRVEEGAVWTDVVLDAEPWLELSKALFTNEFAHALSSVPERCFFVVDDTDAPVGTASAWYKNDHRGLDYGLIHWVAVRPNYQGKGLGKAVLAYALEKLSLWHERAMLGTQSKRLPAIALYLDFGFLPDLQNPDVIKDWRLLRTQLNHPVLNNMDF